MNLIVISNKENTITPKSEDLAKRIKKQKYLVIVNDEGYDYIDELIELLDRVERYCGGRRKEIVIFGEVSEKHKLMLRKIYKNFGFNFFYLQ